MKYKVGDWIVFYRHWDERYEVNRILKIDLPDYYRTLTLEGGNVFKNLGFSVSSLMERESTKIELELLDILYGLTDE